MGLERWEIDSGHSAIRLTAHHLGIAKVHGRFARWSATLLVEDGDVTRATVDAAVDASSIETGLPARDAVLRSPPLLGVSSYPEIRFRSRCVEWTGSGRFDVVGDLTVRDASREVVLHVLELGRALDPWGNMRVGFSARACLDRTAFGLNGDDHLAAIGLLIGECIDVEIDVEVVKQPAATPRNAGEALGQAGSHLGGGVQLAPRRRN